MTGSPERAEDSFTPAEFDCCECARHIIVMSASTVPEMRLCAACQTIPGWFRVPRLRAILDEDHDGLEIWEREAAR